MTASIPQSKASETVRCQNQTCGNLVGQVERINGREYLVVNGFAWTYARGACAKCGTEFHWSTQDRSLAELIQNVISRRSKNVV